MKYLIVGLGNPGAEYVETRHNIGFKVLENLAADLGAAWSEERYGSLAQAKLKGHQLFLLKPSTYMNLSGKAVRYWMLQHKIEKPEILVVLDDLALPYGKLRLKGKGSDGGHNGLKSIQELILGNDYPRLRFGIGAEFSKGRQVDYVLGKWDAQEAAELPDHLKRSSEAIKSFVLSGINITMTAFNQ